MRAEQHATRRGQGFGLGLALGLLLAPALVLGVAAGRSSIAYAQGPAGRQFPADATVAKQADAGAARPSVPPRPGPRVTVWVIEGSNGTGGVDAVLREFPQLSRAPLSAYPQMRLVERSEQPLGQSPSVVRLPNGGSATVTSGGLLPNGRFEVSVNLQVSGRSHAMQFSATPGEPFFNVRATSPTTALVLAFVVR